MYLSNSQFEQVTDIKRPQPNKVKPCRTQNPVVNEYLNLSIKQERLRKLHLENEILKGNRFV